MKIDVQLALKQKITMTPQLQQAIRLLQLSTLELQAEVQQVIESNIMLEEGVEGEEDEYESAEDNTSADDDISSDDTGEEELDELGEINTEFPDIPEELSMDTSWEEFYEIDSFQTHSHHNNSNSTTDPLSNQAEVGKTLKDHLFWQLELSHFSEIDYIIATIIIDDINVDGYLCISFEEVIDSVKNLSNIEITHADIERVLYLIQHFDPVGVGARNLEECLLLQLSEYDESTPWLKESQDLIINHMKLLADRDYTQLAKRMKVNIAELKEITDLIRSLNPRPGSSIESQHIDYIIPDVFVRKTKGEWIAELNQEIIPKVRVNIQYQNLIPYTKNKNDVNSLKKHLQEARWFIKSLNSRHDTLLRVSQCIVERQSAFLEYGEEAMRPLVLHDVAEELGVHESTISRVTTQKYIHTPRGIFELKYFFSSRICTENGRDCSSMAIRAKIKKLISDENSEKPLSDDKIAKILSEQGINVARRTIAKYRESMVIPSSSERKRLTNY